MKVLKPALHALCVLLSFAVLGCGQAKNTPQQALDQLRTALREQKWDLLYEILPVSEQKRWDATVEGFLEQNRDARKQAEQLSALGFEVSKPNDLLKEMKLTQDQWNNLNQRERFVKIFGHNVKINLAQVGINPEFILNSKVKSERISGDRTEIVVDDGKGHQPKLIFVLEGDVWRFQLSGNEK